MSEEIIIKGLNLNRELYALDLALVEQEDWMEHHVNSRYFYGHWSRLTLTSCELPERKKILMFAMSKYLEECEKKSCLFNYCYNMLPMELATVTQNIKINGYVEDYSRCRLILEDYMLD